MTPISEEQIFIDYCRDVLMIPNFREMTKWHVDRIKTSFGFNAYRAAIKAWELKCAIKEKIWQLFARK